MKITAWEYLTQSVDPMKMQGLLNNFGMSGWELVAVLERTGGWPVVIMKRRSGDNQP
jgi:hypothetical protein